MAEGTFLLTGSSESAIVDHASPAPWEAALEQSRPVSAFRISDVFDQSIRTDGEQAISFDPQAEYRIETVKMIGSGIDREDLLRSAEGLRAEREGVGWSLLCALPQPDGLSLMLVFQMTRPPMSDDPPSAEQSVREDADGGSDAEGLQGTT